MYIYIYIYMYIYIYIYIQKRHREGKGSTVEKEGLVWSGDGQICMDEHKYDPQKKLRIQSKMIFSYTHTHTQTIFNREMHFAQGIHTYIHTYI